MLSKDKVLVCPRFWKDVKTLRKRKLSSFECVIDQETDQLPDSVKVTLFPHVSATVNFIFEVLIDRHVLVGQSNNCNQISDIRFTKLSFQVFKLRRAVDKSGSSGGVRYIFAVDQNEYMHLVLVKAKADCENDNELRNEIYDRLCVTQ
jgi:hypothetical protein